LGGGRRGVRDKKFAALTVGGGLIQDENPKMDFSGEVDDYAPQYESKAWIDDEEIEQRALKSPYWNKLEQVHFPMPERSFAPKRELDASRCQSIQRGKDAEKVFVDLASKQWVVHNTSLQEDKVGHIDYYLQKDELQIPLDVKALRCITRNRGLQNKYMWVELHKYGFLFGGQSTCIALQYSSFKFILLNKMALQKMVRNSFSEKLPPVRWNNQAFHRAFKREGTNEWIGFLELLDVVQACAIDIVK
jgi:hypothetical protein